MLFFFLCFVSLDRAGVKLLLISLLFLSFALFYITREFDGLLHQRGAKNDVACVASVSVRFRSKERPRNGILNLRK